jgi:hypothetical protein
MQMHCKHEVCYAVFRVVPCIIANSDHCRVPYLLLTVLLQSTGMCDLNPMTRSVLASPDAVSSTKVLLMKMFIVIAAGCLDSFPTAQVVIVALAVIAVFLIHLQDVSNHYGHSFVA